MDYRNLTAPCGRDCFNCYYYMARTNEKIREVMAEKLGAPSESIPCEGCRNIKGNCQALKNYGFDGRCKTYACAAEKGVEFCSDCSDFPCNLLHPLADKAEKFPHNLKVFNLCMIQKMGLAAWGEHQAKKSWDRYYNDTIDTCF